MKYSDTRCMVCGLERAEDDMSAACRRCKFPFMAIIGDTDEERETARQRIADMAEAYRLKNWTAPKIYLEVYKNAVDDNGVVRVLSAQDIELAEAKGFADGEIRWYGENFARLSGDITLNVSVGRDGEGRSSIALRATNPSIMDFWNVGVKYDGNNMYRVVVGNAEKYTESEAFECR